MDLLDFFAGDRPWLQLYWFLDRLPPWSQYKSEMVMDPEWAKVMCDMEEAGEPLPGSADPLDADLMSPLGYNPVVARLDLVADRVLSLESAVMWTVNPKENRPRIDPLPRPQTALDNERERRTRNLLLEVDSLLTGDGLTLIFE